MNCNRIHSKDLKYVKTATCLIAMGGSDQYNRSIPRYVKGASWSNLPEEDANDHTPKE
jgi:hypothetical protein